MIKKITNWVFGSFFRTMGRFVAFIVLGAVAYILIGKSNIKITDLLGIETIKADTLGGNTIINYYSNPQLTSSYATSSGEHQYIVLNETYGLNSLNVVGAWFPSFNSNWNYMRISYIIAGNTEITTTNNNRWYCNPYQTTSGNLYYECQYFDTYSSQSESYQNVIKFQMNARLIGATYQTQCQIDNSYITCYKNYNDDSPTMLEISYTYLDENNASDQDKVLDLHLSKLVNLFVNDATAITENQNQNHNETMSYIQDSNTTEADTQATNFFSNFTSQDNGGISSIITAPLSAISGLVSATCTPITLPIPYLDNKQLVLPCMSAIYQEHFGSFFTIYQTIIFGAIAYRIVVSIFMMIQGFKNPDDDKIEVVDL